VCPPERAQVDLVAGDHVIDHHVGQLIRNGVRRRIELHRIGRRRQRTAGWLTRRLIPATRGQRKDGPDDNRRQA
jgi:hypothetical protein